jgi:hypothetical protein
MFSGFTSRWTMPRVCASASARGLPDEVNRAHGRKRSLVLREVGEVLAVQELHHVVAETIVGHAVVEDADRVRVREISRRAHLALEARERPRRLLRRAFVAHEDLHRDVALQAVVVRDPHLAHAAGADLLLQLVAPEAARLEDLFAK